MNDEIANSLGEYFETLYRLNQNLITFCGTGESSVDHWILHKYIKAVISAIPQLIPYGYNKKNKQYEIIAVDGLLEYSKEIPFFKRWLQIHFTKSL